ncbi:MAG: hypothetical protein ABI334_09710 [Candidatus Dormiibacterota bacterium]
MPDLEERLALLGADLVWPATPELTGRVRDAISLPARRGGLGWGSPPAYNRWALAAVALILAAGALLAYPPSRDAIAGWVNLHTFIQRVTHLTTPSPLPPGPLGKRLGLGDPTTLNQAQQQVTWSVSIPTSLGTPDEVYLQQPPDGPSQGEVTLVYKARPGIPVAGQTGVAVLVTEARGGVNQDFFGKILGPDATLETVTVSGHQGWWIAGAPHQFFFIDASGNFRSETLRLATNTLILDDGGTVIRIEGDLTKAQALEIAASLS